MVAVVNSMIAKALKHIIMVFFVRCSLPLPSCLFLHAFVQEFGDGLLEDIKIATCHMDIANQTIILVTFATVCFRYC